MPLRRAPRQGLADCAARARRHRAAPLPAIHARPQVSAALRGVGDSELAASFDEARAAIRRDVIFAASLYL